MMGNAMVPPFIFYNFKLKEINVRDEKPYT